MKLLSVGEELRNNSYPGRGIIIGKTPDGKKAVTAYFIYIDILICRFMLTIYILYYALYHSKTLYLKDFQLHS